MAPHRGLAAYAAPALRTQLPDLPAVWGMDAPARVERALNGSEPFFLPLEDRASKRDCDVEVQLFTEGQEHRSRAPSQRSTR